MDERFLGKTNISLYFLITLRNYKYGRKTSDFCIHRTFFLANVVTFEIPHKPGYRWDKKNGILKFYVLIYEKVNNWHLFCSPKISLFTSWMCRKLKIQNYNYLKETEFLSQTQFF